MPKTELYSRLRSQGVCTSCTKQPAASPSPLCQVCKDQQLSAYKKRYNRRRASDLCGQCGEPSGDQSLCDNCRQTQYARTRKRVDSLTAQGLCKRCGATISVTGRIRCDRCLEAARRVASERKRKGMCMHCGGKPAIPKQTRCEDCNVFHREKSRGHLLAHKNAVFSHYGTRCACCGETEPLFLTVDHMNDDGYIHRKTIRSSSIYRWLVKNKFPDGFQLLCWNCNCAKGIHGGCPHQKPKAFVCEAA